MLCLKCQLIVEGNWCLAPGWRCEQLLGKASFQVLSIFWWPSRTCKSRQRMLCLKSQLIVELFCLIPRPLAMESNLLECLGIKVLLKFTWTWILLLVNVNLTLMSVPGTSTSSTASWLEPFCLIPRPLAMESNLVIFSLFDFIIEADFERWTFSPNFDNSTLLAGDLF